MDSSALCDQFRTAVNEKVYGGMADYLWTQNTPGGFMVESASGHL